MYVNSTMSPSTSAAMSMSMLKYPNPKQEYAKPSSSSSQSDNTMYSHTNHEYPSFHHPQQVPARHHYADLPPYPLSPSYHHHTMKPSNHGQEDYTLTDPIMYEYMNHLRPKLEEYPYEDKSTRPYPTYTTSDTSTDYMSYPSLPPPQKESIPSYLPPMTEYSSSSSSSSASSSAIHQQAVIKVKTVLKSKYYRNGRRNIQCFPTCKVFGDYSSIKIEDLKQHDFMWGKCRGSVLTEVTLLGTIEFEDVWILGRVHSLEKLLIPFEEIVIRECMLGQMIEMERMEKMKEEWMVGEQVPNVVSVEDKIGFYEFKPRVWKYHEDVSQGKRRNVMYYIQVEAFIQVRVGPRRYFACIGSGMSTGFEVGSSRVLARQKRKAAGVFENATKVNPINQVQPSVREMDLHAESMTIHPSPMMTHPMIQTDPSHYQAAVQQHDLYTNYPSQAYTTAQPEPEPSTSDHSLTQAYAHPMSHSMESFHPAYSQQHYPYLPQPYPHPYESTSSIVGEKRGFNDLRDERAVKTHKTMLSTEWKT